MGELTLIGIHLEDDDDGLSVVLTDASETEHIAYSPDELWRAVMAIVSDPSLPRASIEPGGEGINSDIHDFAVEAVEGIIGDAAGPTVGRLAGALVRNGGKDAVGFLRRISRGGRG